MKTVILDIDETLVYSRAKFNDSICWNSKEWGESFTLPRRDTLEFLETLKNKGYNLISLTQGVVSFQKEVFIYSGIFTYIKDIYGWEDGWRTRYSTPPMDEIGKWVLVDNLSHRDTDLGEKAEWLGTELDPEKNFVRAGTFYGVETPQTLMGLIPRIEELLNVQQD